MDNIFSKLLTPCHIIDINILKNNISVLYNIKQSTGCKLLFANKGFSNTYFYRFFDGFVDGISASGYYEAKLAKENYKGQVHTFSPSYKIQEFSYIEKYSDVIIFNSINQLQTIMSKKRKIHAGIGLRINPEYSEQIDYRIDPCHPYSRFGVHREELTNPIINSIDGLHLHTMCEQYADTLKNTLEITKKKYGDVLNQVRWLNIGGGQLYTDSGYNLSSAINSISSIKNAFGIDVYIEPCEAFMHNTGVFVSKIVDIVNNGISSVILDSSAICHLPDIVHSPYRCEIANASVAFKKKYTYRICGCSCYAGDIYGDYSFDNRLQIGDYVVFQDTAAYSMVKNNMFNGIRLPYIYEQDSDGSLKLVKSYGYDVYYSFI